MVPEDDMLPPEVLAAWGVTRPGKRGPRAELSLARITEAAIDIADVDGLAAVSMARVAEQIGFTTMALYRHVRSKDELLQHMQDAALGAPPRELTPAGGWRGGLELWARQVLAGFLAHPWTVEIPIPGPPLMPRNLEWMDWALSFLADVPLTVLEKLSTLMVLSGYARNEAVLGRSIHKEREKRGVAPDQEWPAYEHGLRRFVTAENLPALHQLIADGLFDAPAEAMSAEEGDEFIVEFGLQRILDGIEALISRRNR
jgi:AcrR family transcriptional regulator